MRSSRISTAVLCAALCGVGLSAWAASDMHAYVAARQARYKAVGAAFKQVMDALRQTPADLGAMRQSAKTIAQISVDQYQLFAPGSGPESGAPTKAKPAIWSDPAGFKAAQDRFRASAADFAAASARGDSAAITVSARALGGACASCHSRYRQSD